MTRKFLYLNGVAILCVVLFHTAGMGFVAMINWGYRYLPEGVSAFDQIGSVPYYLLRLFEQVVPFCIPAFFIVSGFFVSAMAGRVKKTIGWDIVSARIQTLAIPYLLWSIIALSLKALEGNIYSPIKYVELLLTGKTTEVYYFIPLLIQMYLLSPLLILAARKNWKVLLAVTGVIQFLQLLTYYPQFLGLQNPILLSISLYIPKWLFLSRLFWFSSGIIIGLHPNEFRGLLTKYSRSLAILAIALIPIGVIEWEFYFRQSGQPWLSTRETLVDTLFSIAVIGAFLGSERSPLPFNKSLSDLGTRSYGIYLIHGLVIEYSARLLYKYLPAVLSSQWLLQPVLFMLGAGVPLLMMWFVNKTYLRRFYSYIFG